MSDPVFVNYKSLQLLSPTPIGAGGQVLNSNFTTVADFIDATGAALATKADASSLSAYATNTSVTTLLTNYLTATQTNTAINTAIAAIPPVNLSAYVTNTSLTATLGAYSTTSATSSAINTALSGRTITATTPLTGGGDLSANRTIGINAATASAPGSLSAAHFALLSGATSSNVSNALVQRSGNGSAAFNVATATTLQSPSLNTTNIASIGDTPISIGNVNSVTCENGDLQFSSNDTGYIDFSGNELGNISSINAGNITANGLFAGVARMSTWPVIGGFAYFGHSSFSNSVGGYALLQDSNGVTYLNSPTGLNLSNNNTALISLDSSGIHMNSFMNSGYGALFGTEVSNATATPLNVSFGGTYGTNTPGSAANLKWCLYRHAASGDAYGIGMSGGLMELRAGNSGAIGMFINGGTESSRFLSNGRVLIGTTTDNGTDKLQVNGSVEATSFVPATKPTVSGSKSGNTALASLIAALATLGLIVDSTT